MICIEMVVIRLGKQRVFFDLSIYNTVAKL
jgi:hypothetical protein